MKQRLFFALIALILVCSVSLADETFYPSTISKLGARVTLRGGGTISGLAGNGEATFQTLTFQETDLQKVNIVKEVLHINGEDISPRHIYDEFNNKYAVFTLPQNGDFTYELVADVTVTARIQGISDYNIGTVPAELRQYTLPSEKIESNSREIETIAKNKLLSNGFIDSLNTTVLWVNDYVEYAQGDEFNKYYILQKSALETLAEKKGVCDEFANLGAAVLRAKNIPTRIATGITFDGEKWGNHAWIEVYHEKLGAWIPSDPTFRETGFVDATHIRISGFNDVTLSQAKCTYPVSAECKFSSQVDLPDVQITSKEYFDDVALQIGNTELTTKSWNTVPVEVRNKTQSTIIAPVTIKENYSELVLKQKKQTIQIGPGETKDIAFEIYPKITLNDNQLAKGTIGFNSLSTPADKEMTIKNGPQKKDGEVVIEDVTPLISDTGANLQIKATNFFESNKDISIKIDSDSAVKQQQETLAAFETKNYTIYLQDSNSSQYRLTITTPTTIYTQTIIPAQKQQTPVGAKTQTTENIVEQKINNTQEENPAEFIENNPVIALILVVFLITALLLALIWTNKKYV